MLWWRVARTVACTVLLLVEINSRGSFYLRVPQNKFFQKKTASKVIGRARSHTERQNYSTFTVHIPGSDKEKEEGRKDRQAESSTSKRRDPNEGIKNRIDKGKGKGKVKTKTNIQ